VDDPSRDARRVHTEPIPRWGGIAIYGGIVLALATVLPFAYPFTPFPLYLIGLILLGGVLVAFGALDDLKSFSAKWQLLALLAVGVAIQFVYDPIGRVTVLGMEWPPIGEGYWQDFSWWGVPLTAAYIFVVTKTMDTIDGVDGLAAGIACIAAGTLAVIAKYEDQPRVALIAAAVAGSCVGFLRYNFSCATTSTRPRSLWARAGRSFWASCWLVSAWWVRLRRRRALKTAAALALFIPVLVFGVPLIDAVTVTIRRLLAGQPITQADKRHLHHQLLAKGLNQRQTVLVLYTVTIVLCGLLLTMVRWRG